MKDTKEKTKKAAAKKPQANKPPAERTLKIFFNAIREGRADDVAKQVAKLGTEITYTPYAWVTPPLAYAAGQRNSEGCVRVLLDAGADVHGVDAHGSTPLHNAAAQGNLETVTLLLERGAKVDARDGKGLTPYAKSHSAQVRKLLRSRGEPGFGARGGTVIEARVKENVKNIELDRGAIGRGGDGMMWFGAYAGLFRHDGKTTTRFNFDDSMAIDSIGAGPADVTYIATNWGLIEYKDGTFTRFSSQDSDLFDHHIVYMRVSPDGRPHMISYEREADHKHISVFDGTHFKVLEPGVDFPPEIELKSLAFDTAGNLVIGGDEVLAFQQDGKWQVVRDFRDYELYSTTIHDVLVEPDVMWLGTSSGPVEYRGGKLIVHKSKLVKTMAKDGDTLWFGTYYDGLGRLQGGEITIFKKEDSELPHDDVHAVVRADDGTIWVYAGNGLATVKNGTLERFD